MSYGSGLWRLAARFVGFSVGLGVGYWRSWVSVWRRAVWRGLVLRWWLWHGLWRVHYGPLGEYRVKDTVVVGATILLAGLFPPAVMCTGTATVLRTEYVLPSGAYCVNAKGEPLQVPLSECVYYMLPSAAPR